VRRHNGGVTPEWARYWRARQQPLEAMHAHFTEHVYHRHSHETYSFGVTEDGAQTFRCRGGRHTSATGMVMAFNPDDPHDGHSATELGFTYRMVHIGPELVPGRPLFAEPVVDDPVLAGALRALHGALLANAPALKRDELLDATVAAIVRRASTRPAYEPTALRGSPVIAERVRRRIHEGFLDDLTAEDLADAVGGSRFAVYRAFRSVYGMAPSDYQRQLRLREARRRIAAGRPIGEVASETGFADQSHLTRWFGRYFGITPRAYRDASP
jgi:AraC-like DNA-binding protein